MTRMGQTPIRETEAESSPHPYQGRKKRMDKKVKKRERCGRCGRFISHICWKCAEWEWWSTLPDPIFLEN